MGCWGMGITQSDEYCEIYERFMEEYDEGKPVADITKDILDEYLDDFEEHDRIDSEIFDKIEALVNSRDNALDKICKEFDKQIRELCQELK